MEEVITSVQVAPETIERGSLVKVYGKVGRIIDVLTSPITGNLAIQFYFVNNAFKGQTMDLILFTPAELAKISPATEQDLLDEIDLYRHMVDDRLKTVFGDLCR